MEFGGRSEFGERGSALTASSKIETRFDFAARVRKQASTLLSIHEADTRTGYLFATQQRWLLAHITLSTYFESLVSGEEYGLRASAVLDAAVAHAVASRNTADSFLKEMVNYGYIAYA